MSTARSSSRRRARATPPLVAALCVVLLAACSSGGAAATSAASTPAGSAAGSAPAEQASPTSSSVFALLPDSVLADLSPLTYAAPAGADAAMAAQGAKPTVNAVFSGGISRELAYQGKSVGGVELYRFAGRVPADSRPTFVPLMVESFAQKASTPGTLGTQKVQVADGARGTGITVIGWARGDDVVLVWAQGLPATQQIAEHYLTQTGGG